MKLLVTGASGFVGRHVCTAAGALPDVALITPSLDITDRAAVFAAIAETQPDAVLHLAAIAANADARADPKRAWDVNLFGTLNIADAILAAGTTTRLLFISTGEVYGASFLTGAPLDETALPQPQNLYAATKAAAEMALSALRPAGLHHVVLRPFNHIGPGQDEKFVAPAFAAQIARIEAGAPPTLSAGNLAAERDFLDVRDVCAAYLAALACFDTLPPVLNIASGRTLRIGTILEDLLALSRVQITVQVDPSRLRAAEIPRAVGDARLAQRVLGWAPVHRVADTLAEVLEEARKSSFL